MKRTKGLGRGLDALLGGDATTAVALPTTMPLARLQPGKYQPRTKMNNESLRELADSIIEGKQGRTEKPEDTQQGQQPRRRSSRSQFRAEEGAPAPVGGTEGANVEIPAATPEMPAPVEQVPAGQPVAQGA